MDLLCTEKLDGATAGPHLDKVVYTDTRVLLHLLFRETRDPPIEDYFREENIQPHMRQIIASWMFELCEREGCEDQVLPLAVFYLDRFLGIVQTHPDQLQITACACLLIASKIRECRTLTLSALITYCENNVTEDHLRGCESMVLTKLKWELAGVTAYDFVDQLIQRLPYTPHRLLRNHTVTLLALSYTVIQLMKTRRSELACAAIVAAARGLNLQPDLLPDVCLLCKADPATVERLVDVVEKRFQEERVKELPSVMI